MCYSVYLLHLFVLLPLLFSAREALIFSYADTMVLYLKVVVFSYLLAIPFALAFEVPIMSLEKLLLFPPKKKRRTDNGREYMPINDAEKAISRQTS